MFGLGGRQIAHGIQRKLKATGGTITDVNISGIDYRVHTFTSSGTFNVTSGSGDIEFVIVGAGGAGGYASNGGGGGGAGGYLSSVQGELSGRNSAALSVYPVLAGSYTITVGSGTTGQGQSSSAFGYTAIGGGAGGQSSGGSGGSGGGSGYLSPGSGTTGQGFNGASGYNLGGDYYGGGGGGAGSGGTNGSLGSVGSGGAGITTNISGTPTTYARGGRGTRDQALGAWAGSNGAANTGNGAIPWNYAFVTSTGGSGIVIVRYPI